MGSGEMSESEVEQLLDESRRLLERAGEPQWAAALARLESGLVAAPRGAPARSALLHRVLQMYGGMGSFRDLVLQSEGIVRAEQAEFSSLRDRLFAAALAEVPHRQTMDDTNREYPPS